MSTHSTDTLFRTLTLKQLVGQSLVIPEDAEPAVVSAGVKKGSAAKRARR